MFNEGDVFLYKHQHENRTNFDFSIPHELSVRAAKRKKYAENQ